MRVALALAGTETEFAATNEATSPPEKLIDSGLPFLDHMLEALRLHGQPTLRSLEVGVQGDLEVDDHHTVEDCAITLGQALRKAMYERTRNGGVVGFAPKRFGWALIPLDEALAQVAIDLSGRSFCVTDLGLKRETIGGIAAENFDHFFRSLSQSLQASIHIRLLAGSNDHHRIEAAFKGFAQALAQSLTLIPETTGNSMRSTKGDIQ